ncbi:hypothetical protein [Streptomyces sp. L2]|uniref:hypothetical protein n=1 Tax=Streptomyces sp. L2 TaxID=2162665 RepID=UPI00101081EB|nr:hypothetical protein [Streptomyces sp. L2]
MLEHLRAHPDALVSGDSSGPPGLLKLLDVLAAEHQAVQRARCAQCGTVRRLPYRIDGAATCGRCYARSHLKPCVRCGETGRPAFRENGGVVCAGCKTRDPRARCECARCGKLARVAYRIEGRPLCQNCGPRKLYTCSACGRHNQRAHEITEDGPLCPRCYHRARERQCCRCGRTTWNVRIADRQESTWICYRCWIPPTTRCTSCGQNKPCVRGATLGRPVCSTCHSRQRPERTCARCGRTKKMRTTLPLGPVCGLCYNTLRRSPAPCTNCGCVRPLVGRGERGGVCGPCSGDERNWTCRRCGRVDLLVAQEHCLPCIVSERVDALLSGPDGTLHPQLSAVRALLLQDCAPEQVLHWLYATVWAELLGRLATQGGEITHARLDRLPPGYAVRYLRQVLVNTGVLEPRTEHLDSVEPWVEHLLAGQPPHIAAIVRPYASWSVLRRARSLATRSRVTRSVRKYARSRIGMAVQFLTWLETRGLTLSAATQSDVDLWLAIGTTTHYRLRDFLRWAHARGLADGLTVPWLGRAEQPEHVLPDDDRWRLLRRCLNDDSIALHLRVAGALVLLYAQVPSRIVELTRQDLSTTGSGTYLAVGRQPVLLPPRLAMLVQRLANHAAPGRRPLIHRGTRPWLFPSAQPGTHLDADRLATLLNDRVGIFIRPARGGALCELAGDLPAPVLAELLGLSVGTATRWTTLAGRDWSDYLTARAEDLSIGTPG